ncbi:hypothetical protein V8C86DRAFT_2818357 [Haematococcus lacustris]
MLGLTPALAALPLDTMLAAVAGVAGVAAAAEPFLLVLPLRDSCSSLRFKNSATKVLTPRVRDSRGLDVGGAPACLPHMTSHSSATSIREPCLRHTWDSSGAGSQRFSCCRAHSTNSTEYTCSPTTSGARAPLATAPPGPPPPAAAPPAAALLPGTPLAGRAGGAGLGAAGGARVAAAAADPVACPPLALPHADCGPLGVVWGAELAPHAPPAAVAAAGGRVGGGGGGAAWLADPPL